MNSVEDQIQMGKVIRYVGKNFIVKAWRGPCGIYYVSYRWHYAGANGVEYLEYTYIKDAIAEFFSASTTKGIE